VNNLARHLRSVTTAAIAAGLAAGTALAFSTLPAAWNAWRYSRAIELAPTDAPRLVQTAIPDAVYLRAQPSLADLRIIDAQGNETPYTLFSLDGETKLEHRAATVHEKSFTPGQYTQTVVEVKGDTFHNSIEIQTTEQNFIEWVTVDASDDAHTWRIVQDRAPIFRFNKDGREGTRVVHYSDNNARFLRLRILDGDKQFPITGVLVLDETSGPEERVPLETVQPSADPNSTQRKSMWSADLGGNSPPVTEVVFDVGPGEFIREVRLSASADAKDWRNEASGQIYRFHRGDKVQEQLKVEIPYGGRQYRHWRIDVENRNDAPLPINSVLLYTTPRRIAFEQQPGKTYTLIYGQQRAKAPQYDLGQRIDSAEQRITPPGHLGSEETNTAWVDPRPWTETHDALLWAVLIVSVLLIGSTAIQSMRRAATNPSGPR
jgi:Protein of unknown function (DUF3999)